MTCKKLIISFLAVLISVPFVGPVHAQSTTTPTAIPQPYTGVWNTDIGSSTTAQLAFSGWAANRTNSAEIVSVQIARGTNGETIVATIPADRGSPLATSTGITGNHRFRWDVPLEFYGKTNTWHVSLVRADGSKVKLINSPRTFAFGPAPRQPEGGRFKIFWSINTNIEPLADLAPNTPNATDLARVKSAVQGYYVNLLNGGKPSYWPNRPRRCDFVDVNDAVERPTSITIASGTTTTTYNVDELRVECNALFASSTAAIANTRQDWKKLSLGAAQGRIHEDALKRALSKLGLQEEIAAGKQLDSQLIMGDQIIDYDPEADILFFKKSTNGTILFPKTYGFLRENGYIATGGMAYQEPSLQAGSRLLQIPYVRGGTRYGKLPENGRILNMYGNAFVAAEVASPKMRPNVRVWDTATQKGLTTMLGSAHFGGLNVEGGTLGIELDKVGYYAKAIAWLFQNSTSDKQATILMPPNITLEEAADQALYDRNQIDRVYRYMRTLDRELKNNGVKAGVCTDDLVIMVGGYSRWLHPEMFPIARGGRIAGTTSGIVMTLDKLRTDMCGTGQVAGAATEDETLFRTQLAALLTAMETELKGLLELLPW